MDVPGVPTGTFTFVFPSHSSTSTSPGASVPVRAAPLAELEADAVATGAAGARPSRPPHAATMTAAADPTSHLAVALCIITSVAPQVRNDRLALRATARHVG